MMATQYLTLIFYPLPVLFLPPKPPRCSHLLQCRFPPPKVFLLQLQTFLLLIPPRLSRPLQHRNPLHPHLPLPLLPPYLVTVVPVDAVPAAFIPSAIARASAAPLGSSHVLVRTTQRATNALPANSALLHTRHHPCHALQTRSPSQARRVVPRAAQMALMQCSATSPLSC